MRYAHVVFDVDGTILDTAQCILHALRDTLHILGIPVSEEKDLRFALGMTSENVLRSLSVNEADIPTVIDQWVKKEEECSGLIRPFPGIEPLLNQLRQAGIQLGIVTSRTHGELDLVFKPFSLEHFFSTVICADDTVEHKPSPAPLLRYMERTGCRPDDVLYVGDSPQDMECAKRAGTDFALAVWGSVIPETESVFCPRKPSDLSSIILS